MSFPVFIHPANGHYVATLVGSPDVQAPRDFLRTATRANRYPLVQKLWGEHFRGEELSRRIPGPK
jgi:hypothetical protein